MNNPLDTTLFDKAATFAIKAHANTERRGKGFPYIIHAMEAAEIVATITSDQELLAAAILHDTVEDTDVTLQQLAEEFGPRVAQLVESESDLPAEDGGERGSWRDRKLSGIARLQKATRDAKIVALGDKLSNMRAIARDYDQMGDKLWSRFHAPNGKADHAWRYRALANALFELAETEAYQEFADLVEHTFGEMTVDAPALVNMDEYEESGAGFFGTSYNHRDGISMIKFYNKEIPISTPWNEYQRARSVKRMGIPTPPVGRFITDGTRFGIEFRRIHPKQSFSRHIANNPDSYKDIAVRFATMCKRLHTTPCDKTQFESVKEHYYEVIETTPHFNEEEKAKMRSFLDGTPDAGTCVHGDMHIGNVITDGMRDFWIDMGDFRWGNPLFDMGMFYFVCKCDPDELTMHLFHINNQQMQQVWDIFVHEYFGVATPAEQEAVEATIRPYAALRMVHLCTIDRPYPPMVDFIRRYLING